MVGMFARSLWAGDENGKDLDVGRVSKANMDALSYALFAAHLCHFVKIVDMLSVARMKGMI